MICHVKLNLLLKYRALNSIADLMKLPQVQQLKIQIRLIEVQSIEMKTSIQL